MFNEGGRSQVAELFDFAVDLQGQVDHLVSTMKQVQVQVQDTLAQLVALYPESLAYADLDEVEPD